MTYVREKVRDILLRGGVVGGILGVGVREERTTMSHESSPVYIYAILDDLLLGLFSFEIEFDPRLHHDKAPRVIHEPSSRRICGCGRSGHMPPTTMIPSSRLAVAR